MDTHALSDTEGGYRVQLRKKHTFQLFAYINSWTERQCLCCFNKHKHLEIFNQVLCALISDGPNSGALGHFANTVLLLTKTPRGKVRVIKQKNH